MDALYKMWCKQFITDIILVAAQGLWHLGSLFYHNTQYSQRGWYVTNLICVIFCETRHHAHAHVTSCALIHCVPFLWLREEHRWQHSWVSDLAGHYLIWWLLLRLAAVVLPPLLLLLLLLLLLFFLLLLLLILLLLPLLLPSSFSPSPPPPLSAFSSSSSSKYSSTSFASAPDS